MGRTMSDDNVIARSQSFFPRDQSGVIEDQPPVLFGYPTIRKTKQLQCDSPLTSVTIIFLHNICRQRVNTQSPKI